MTDITKYSSTYRESWALVIGINEYDNISPLEHATNDATVVSNVLKKRFGFPEENIIVLLNKHATKTAIIKSFMSFTKKDKIQPDDRILVFFAGHGHTILGKRGEVGFLIPSDGKTEEVESLIRWDDLTRNSDLVQAKHVLFFMDACYGGLALKRSPAFGSMRFLGDMLKRYARQVLTAGKADETVADGNGIRPGHSIFTAHLLNALEGAAATQEGIITASGVMAYVYDRVGRDQYSHQTPHYGFFDGDGDFIFDLSPLDELRSSFTEAEPKGEAGKGTKGERDVLINTSPQVVVTPVVGKSVVETMKELLPDPSKQIILEDFVSQHVRHFLDATDLRHFPVQDSAFSNEDFIERVNSYDSLSKDLQQIVILLAKWGEKKQLHLLETVFKRIAEADKGSSGLRIWLKLTWYPVLYLIYSAGISALNTSNYEALCFVLKAPVEVEFGYNGKRVPLVLPVAQNLSEINDSFKKLPGHDRHYVPRSEHLFKVLQPVLEDILFLGKSYESVFDEFEVLLALTYIDAADEDWGPIGRFGWKQRHGGENSPFEKTLREINEKKENWELIRYGIVNGPIDRFAELVGQFRQRVHGLNWW